MMKTAAKKMTKKPTDAERVKEWHDRMKNIGPVERMRVKLANVGSRLGIAAKDTASWPEGLSAAIVTAQAAVDEALGKLAQIPADFKPARKSGGASINVGDTVKIKEKKRADLEGLIDHPEDVTGAFTVLARQGMKFKLKGQSGDVLPGIARADITKL
jgi:hypothetical protein